MMGYISYLILFFAALYPVCDPDFHLSLQERGKGLVVERGSKKMFLSIRLRGH